MDGLGDTLMELDSYPEAEEAYRAAVGMMQALIDENPQETQYRLDLADHYLGVCWDLHARGLLQGATEAARGAVALAEDLVAGSPEDLECHEALVFSLNALLIASEKYDLDVMTRTVHHAGILVESDPTDLLWRDMLARWSRKLAEVLLAQGRDDEAKAVWQQLVEVIESGLDEAPASGFDLAMVLSHLGQLLEDTGRTEEAEQLRRKAESVRGELMARSPNLAYEYRTVHPDYMDGPAITVESVDYAVRITTPGEYRLYVRGAGHDTRSDGCYVWIEELYDGPGGSVSDWYFFESRSDADFGTAAWLGTAQPETKSRPFVGTFTAAAWPITTPGDYTIRFARRDDGAAIDAFALQLSYLPVPTGDGPEESPVTGEMVFLESDGRVVVEAEHFTSRTPGTVGNWLIVPEEDAGEGLRRNFRGAGYVQAVPDTSPTT
jgi:tetratricopeptide (TPR) repeat protein